MFFFHDILKLGLNREQDLIDTQRLKNKVRKGIQARDSEKVLNEPPQILDLLLNLFQFVFLMVRIG